MLKRSRLTLASFTWLAVSALISSLGAEEPKQAAPPAKVDKATVLKWIADYRDVQVLFNDADIAKLQKELSDGTPEEAQRWWQRTAKVRAALESPEWLETREWLREFLRVQAIYSDEEIAEFQAEAKEAAGKESPREFKEILARIETRRKNLIQSTADSKKLREHQLSVIRAFRKEDEAARRAAATVAASRPRRPVTQPVQRRPPRYAPAPLIDSLDVARWSVMRNFWRY